jgi:hypothetical protein
LVETVVPLEVSLDLGRDGFLGREGTAGHQAQHEKRRRDDDEQHGNRLEQTSGEKAEHAVGSGDSSKRRTQGFGGDAE